jgi:phage-related protein
MKPIEWIGSSKEDLSAFPSKAKEALGYQLFLLENGESPDDFDALPTVGSGACEIRVQIGEDFRVIYVAKWADAIYVLHATHKKSQKIRPGDLELAKRRYKEAQLKSSAKTRASNRK